MFKKTITFLLLTVFLISCIASVNVFAEPAGTNKDSSVRIDLKAKAYILFDSATGNVLLEKNTHTRLPIASVTKIMTILLVMESVEKGKIKFEDMVPVSHQAFEAGGPNSSSVFLEPGEEFSVLEMLRAVIIQSANDASVALAEFVAGSEDAFVDLMNEKAKELGMNDTHFLDCTGLTDDGHYSSPYDIALMARELISKYPKVTEYTIVRHSTFRNGKTDLDNTNKLVTDYKGCIGLKTGFTTKAGYNLAAVAQRNNMTLYSVVLGEPDSNSRFNDSKKLLDYGFANFQIVELDKKGTEVKKGAETVIAEVKKGIQINVKVLYGNDIMMLVKKGEQGKVEREVNLQENIMAPVKAGQKIGEVIYRIDDREVNKADIVAASDVDKASFMKLFFRMVMDWFGLGRK